MSFQNPLKTFEMSQQVEWFSRAASSVSLINRSVGVRFRNYSYSLGLRRQGYFSGLFSVWEECRSGTGMACIKKGGNKIVESDEMKKLTLAS